jgi:hypothetical protein
MGRVRGGDGDLLVWVPDDVVVGADLGAVHLGNLRGSGEKPLRPPWVLLRLRTVEG